MKDLDMAKRIARKVDELGGSTYYVGGYVRDAILHKTNKDIDIEIHNITNQQLSHILSQLGQVQTQGASFGVYNIKGYGIDIAQPRMEEVTGRGHKDFDVTVDPFIGTKKAARRRDFTMNALMQNVITGEIIDHYGGLDDLKNCMIRHVDDNTFKEDPLRVLRAAQFAARFDFQVHPDTKKIMQSMSLQDLSSERIYGELEKALTKADNPSVFFDTLRDVDQLDVWFPEVKRLIDVPQNQVWHPEGDVYTHTMMTLDAAATLRDRSSNPSYFMMSALCHDFGKPNVTTQDARGIYHSYQHEVQSEIVAKCFLQRINKDKDLQRYVLDMVRQHDEPNHLFNGNSSPARTNIMFDKSVCPQDLILLNRADNEGTTLNDTRRYDMQQGWLYERLQEYTEVMKEPQVTGRDLINLGMKPGPEFSKILEDAHKKHLSYVAKDDVIDEVRATYLRTKGNIYRVDGLTDEELAVFNPDNFEYISLENTKVIMETKCARDMSDASIQKSYQRRIRNSLKKGTNVVLRGDYQDILNKYGEYADCVIDVVSKHKQVGTSENPFVIVFNPLEATAKPNKVNYNQMQQKAEQLLSNLAVDSSCDAEKGFDE